MNADALSRRPCSQCGVEDVSLVDQPTVAVIESSNWMPTVDIPQHQEADPDLSQMITWLKTDTLPSKFPRNVSRRLQTLWSQRQQLVLENGMHTLSSMGRCSTWRSTQATANSSSHSSCSRGSRRIT